MSTCQECTSNLNNAHQAGSTWNFCPEAYCQDTSNYIHAFCNCQGQFSVYPFVQNGVCMSGPGTLIAMAEKQCYCCCNCLMPDTQIATSKDSDKTAHDFNVNDMVLVATTTSLKKWVQKPVVFSAGTGSNTGNRLLKIHFGDQNKAIRVTSKSFVSTSVSPQQSAAYYRILSKAPNNFIRKGGEVNQDMLSKAGTYVLSELLGVDSTEAGRIYSILNPGPKQLIVTPDQPFLMQDGTLKQANKIVPGKDVLVCSDGSPTPVHSVETGLFKKGVHHIATSVEKATSANGHLLLANGVVIGDYATLIGMSTQNSSMENKYKNHPALGSKEYNKVNMHLDTTATGAFTRQNEK